MQYCAPATAWRLVLLKGGVASEASYPAWPVTEKARLKVLVFLPPPSVLWTVVMPYCSHYRLYFACNRMAVGPFKGWGCERSELPCLVCDGVI